MRKTGFLLFELMVAVVILSVSLTVISRSFIQTLSALRTSGYFFKGGLLLEKKMWELEEKPPSPGREEGTFEEFGKLFHWTASTTEMEKVPLYETAVTVGWTLASREQGLTVETYLTKPDEPKEK